MLIYKQHSSSALALKLLEARPPLPNKQQNRMHEYPTCSTSVWVHARRNLSTVFETPGALHLRVLIVREGGITSPHAVPLLGGAVESRTRCLKASIWS